MPAITNKTSDRAKTQTHMKSAAGTHQNSAKHKSSSNGNICGHSMCTARELQAHAHHQYHYYKARKRGLAHKAAAEIAMLVKKRDQLVSQMDNFMDAAGH